MKELLNVRNKGWILEISNYIALQRYKMISNKYMVGTLVGVLSGLLLGFFLKWLEILTDEKVYTLLLNIDFIPIIGTISWPEWIEFAFHLFVSIAIGLLFTFLAAIHKVLLKVKGIWGLSFLLTIPTIFLFFPLSIVAVKEVPSVHNYLALSLWTIGHIVYAVSLPIIYKLFKYQPAVTHQNQNKKG